MKAAAVATLASLSAAHNIETLYAKYVAQYNKSYLTQEEFAFRQAIFAKNHFLIAEHNMGNSHSLAHNKFSDWTEAELATLTGYLPDLYPSHVEATLPTNYTGPASIDWRSSLASMKVTKDQGQCGSCWAFSTVGSIEARSEIAKKGYVSLSEQQLVDCVVYSFGCQGGNFFAAFDYSRETGNTGETDYKYTASNGTCKDTQHPIRNHHTSDFIAVPQNSPAALKAEIVNGPVSVAIEADQPVFQFYNGGVIKPADCGKQLDHAVLAIGYGTEAGQDYFLIRNSWGPNWGDHGTVKLGFNAEECACGCDIQPGAVITKA
jgi:C1A family cysteine protease